MKRTDTSVSCPLMCRTFQHVLKDDRVQSLLQRGVGSPSKEEQGAAVVEEEISNILVGETVCVYLVGVCVCLCGPWMGCLPLFRAPS